MEPSVPATAVVHGDGLVLTPWTDADIPAVLALAADPVTLRWAHSLRRVTTEDDARAWLAERVTQERIDWAVRDAGTGRFLGRVGLHSLEPSLGFGEIGYGTTPSARRHGVATRAVDGGDAARLRGDGAAPDRAAARGGQHRVLPRGDDLRVRPRGRRAGGSRRRRGPVRRHPPARPAARRSSRPARDAGATAPGRAGGGALPAPAVGRVGRPGRAGRGRGPGDRPLEPVRLDHDRPGRRPGLVRQPGGLGRQPRVLGRLRPRRRAAGLGVAAPARPAQRRGRGRLLDGSAGPRARGGQQRPCGPLPATRSRSSACSGSSCSTPVDNPASCRVATRAGFALEGTHRSSFRYGDGRLHDEHSHARLAADAELSPSA